MMRRKEKKAFVVEVQDQSYRTFVCDRWPVSVATLPNELLSSWLQRVAHANGIAPYHVASTLGLGNGFGPVKLDQSIPDRVASLLNNYTGMDSATLAAMSFGGTHGNHCYCRYATTAIVGSPTGCSIARNVWVRIQRLTSAEAGDWQLLSPVQFTDVC